MNLLAQVESDMSVLDHDPGSARSRAVNFSGERNMSSDDPANNQADSSEDDKATPPTIASVFRLLQEVRNGQTSLSSRIDALESRFEGLDSSLTSRIEALESSVNSRFEALESRLTSDFAGVNARFAEMKTELLRLSDKLSDRIDRSRLHAEADIEDITRRLRKLESKAPEAGEDRSTA
jgi:hypothetical protein